MFLIEFNFYYQIIVIAFLVVLIFRKPKEDEEIKSSHENVKNEKQVYLI